MANEYLFKRNASEKTISDQKIEGTMKSIRTNHLVLSIALIFWGSSEIFAQSSSPQASSVSAGKYFAKSMLPTDPTKIVPDAGNAASKKSTNAPDQTPLYTTDQPLKSGFSAELSLATQGSNAVNKCKNYQPSGDPVKDQECAGVNFLANNPIKSQFIIQQNDPIRKAFNSAAASAVNQDLTGGLCVTKTVTTPGTFTNEVCSQSMILDTIDCERQLLPQCSYKAAPITSYKFTNLGTMKGTLTASQTIGDYSFKFVGGGGTWLAEGMSTLTFNLDSLGFGSYVNIFLNVIDDAGAIFVNGIPVYAGLPNIANIQMFYSDLGSPTTPSFAYNYQWTESFSTPAVPGYQYFDIDMFMWVDVPPIPAKTYTDTFKSSIKVLDTCPTKYASIGVVPTPSIRDKFYCTHTTTQVGDPEVDCVDPINTDTRTFMMGLFCNSEGKLMLNPSEGNGYGTANLGATMPLKQGENTITVWWDTFLYHGGGGMTVTGNIHNVAPTCTSNWNDGCGLARSSSSQ
jgi:hypothetical protein